MSGELFMGVDIGSTASKCVILRGDAVAAKAVVGVGAGTSGPGRVMAEALQRASASLKDIRYIVATGYGRNTLREADSELSELSCHARGASYFFPGVRTVIDIGGQDAKAMRLSPEGRMLNFVMNDKCAAGTGRFLDVMARVLEVEVEQLAELDALSTVQVRISSTCTVFAESEVISQLAAGTKARDIIAGIHRSVASRAAGLVRRVGVLPRVVMTGGVARNAGVVRALSAELGVEVETSAMAQFAGAMGAALIAKERAGAQQTSSGSRPEPDVHQA